MTRLAIALTAFGLGIVAASAAPPPGADPTSTTAAWYRSLKNPSNGISCCDLSDCRPVEYRINGEHYEIRQDDRWLIVPASVVLHRNNPTGEGVACIVAGAVWCFVPGSGT